MEPGLLKYTIECAECHSRSSAFAVERGWRGYPFDDPETDAPAEVVFFCGTCAVAEFGAGEWAEPADVD